MKRTLIIIGGVLVLASIGAIILMDLDDWTPFRDSLPEPIAKGEKEKKVLAVLDEMESAGKTYLGVSAADGRMLR